MKISKIEKIIVTLLIGLTWFGAFMIHQTMPYEYPSQSYTADKDNKIWYILMHIGMAMTFYFLGSMFGKKRFMYTITAFMGIGVAALDMFGYSLPHNIFTALLFAGASYCTIKYMSSTKVKELINSVVIGILSVLFIFSVINPCILFTVKEIEQIIELYLGTNILIHVWTTKYRTNKDLSLVR